MAPSASQELEGAVLQGAASDGTPVEVAVCDAEVSAEDPSLVKYQIQVWNGVSASWENPCIATGRVPSPRALAVPGVWDESGARSDKGGKFTFACENGAIAKCVNWGYRPWAKKEGSSLAELHRACTRMARADYCGDGRSHTRDNNLIDMYDGLNVSTRTKVSSAAWDVNRASFEAAWSTEGATCLSRTRDGQEVETLMAQCPGRFELAQKDLGEGDQCTVVRKGGGAKAALLRNRSYGRGEQVMRQGVTR
ncbi:ADYC domain-containing protein [Cystobacter fuscus]